MKLSELIRNLPNKQVIGNADIPVSGITYDSRQVGRDFIFAAVKGQHLDGRAFVKDALARGASAVIMEEAFGDLNAVQIVVPDAREAMALVAAAFYGEPCRNMTLIGVTGTNGKTTITYLVESILRTAGFNAGVVGTINYRYKDKIFNAPHTTPEAPNLQRIFREMSDSGVTHCVMEVSSHSLAQKRVLGSRIIGGVFTNLTQDHLDYHKTMEEYFESKSMLFTDFVARERGGFAVINTDDPWGLKLKTMSLQVLSRDQNLAPAGFKQGSKLKTIGYSLKQDAEIRPAKASFSEKGIDASLNTPIGAINISSALLGEYNLQNIMAAVGVGIGLALDKKTIEKGIAALKRVPGRLERIISEDGFQAVVDYAHTGDALERVIGALKPLAKKRLITVFGCGGDRDRGKRPVMGEIATRLSDFTVITSDNPRTEDPLEIIKEVEAGINTVVSGQWSVVRKVSAAELQNISLGVKCYTVIPDRHEAIIAAVNLAAAGDIILVAGKGHEDYQIIGDRKIPFDDTKEIKKAMDESERCKLQEARSKMVRLPINDIVHAVNGSLISGNENVRINGISTDSRTVNKGELFFALKGPRFDGNKFIDDVFKKGAAGAVVNSKLKTLSLQVLSRGQNLAPADFKQGSKLSIIKVEDTLAALGDLAGYWRELHPVPLIAVSGTCGKTTTKEMVASILKNSRPIIKTEGNLNNLIGLPLTIFNLNNIHKAAVVELGISEKGEMKRLAQICKPDVAVLTNIGEAHTATMGNIKDIASEKCELFRAVGKDGTIAINIDDPWLKKEGESLNKKKITFSLKAKADVMLKDYAFDPANGISAVFTAMGDEIPVRLNCRGMHNLANAAAAIAAVIPLEVTKEEIAEGLNAGAPMSGRMGIVTLANGVAIIDDTYNANPLSMEAAINTLADMKGRRIAVLGDMLELGAVSVEAHKRIGRLVQDTRIDMLFTIGGYSDDMVSGAMERGMLPDKIYNAQDKTDLIKALNRVVKEGDVILVKGSRAAAMEDVVQKLMTICDLRSTN